MPEEQIDNTHYLILNHFNNYKTLHQSSKNKSDIQNFLEKLTKPNIYIAVQSVLDAIDIQLSLFKFYFEAFLAGNDKNSFKNFISAGFGKFIYLISALLIGSLSFVANLDIDQVFAKNSLLKTIAKQADTIWPFFRDACKAIKWTHKGLLSMVTILDIFFPSIKLIVNTLGLTICFISMTNRLNNRYIIENRKKYQTQNRNNVEFYNSINLFCINQTQDFIKNFKHCSTSLKKIYNGKLIQIEHQSQKRIYVVKKEKLKLLYLHISKEQLSLMIRSYPLEALKKYQNSLFLCEYKFFSFNINDQNQIIWFEWSEDNTINEYPLSLTSKIEELFNTFNFNEYLNVLKDMNITVDVFQTTLLEELEKETCQQPFRKHAQFSAFLTGLLNAPYYFLGILALVDYKNLTTNMQKNGLAGCSTLIAMGCLSEYYQEADYQRKLMITAEYSKITIYRQLIIKQYNHICHLMISQPHDKSMSPNFNNLPVPDYVRQQIILTADQELIHFLNLAHSPIPKIPLDHEYIDLFKKLSGYIKQYKLHMSKENDLLLLDKKSKFWGAVRSSLQIIGIYTNIMVLLKSIPTLNIKFFPDWTISVYGGFSICASVYSFNENYLNLNTVQLVEKTKQIESKKQIIHNSLFYQTPELTELLEEENLTTTDYKMYAEQCDMIRQPISGAKKGLKNIENFISPEDGDQNYHPTHQLIFFLTSGIYAVFFALKSARMSLRVDNEAYKKSIFFKRFYHTDERSYNNTVNENMPLEEKSISLSQ